MLLLMSLHDRSGDGLYTMAVEHPHRRLHDFVARALIIVRMLVSPIGPKVDGVDGHFASALAHRTVNRGTTIQWSTPQVPL